MNLRALVPASLVALLAAQGAARANDYYMATNGNDNPAGTSSAPWATLQGSVPKLHPGDRLLIADGTYNQSFNATGINGAAGSPITIAAQHEGAAILKGPGPLAVGQSGTPLFGLTSSSYVTLVGLAAEDSTGADFQFHFCHDISLRRVVARRPSNAGNYHCFCFWNSPNNTVEECQAWEFHRHGFCFFEGQCVGNVIRRSYANGAGRLANPAYLHGGAQEGVSAYGASNTLIENCIVENLPYGGGFEDHATENGGHDNKFLGCIALRTVQGFFAETRNTVDTTRGLVFEDCVAFGSLGPGWYLRSDQGVSVKNSNAIECVTGFLVDVDTPNLTRMVGYGALPLSVTFTNCLAWKNTNVGFFFAALPSGYTGPVHHVLYHRSFAKLEVYVNPTASPISVNVAAGWRAIDTSVAPKTVWNGGALTYLPATTTSVTIGSGEAALFVP